MPEAHSPGAIVHFVYFEKKVMKNNLEKNVNFGSLYILDSSLIIATLKESSPLISTNLCQIKFLKI